MANKVKKGYRTEKRCADELKEQGYIIWKTIRVQYQNIDLFGLYDVVALHPEGEHILFIQCKTNRTDNKTRDAIRDMKMPAGCQKWIWIWKDRKGWVKEFYESQPKRKRIKPVSGEYKDAPLYTLIIKE